ncbi:MAG: hypothetical protein OXT09_13040 [Myxococcales bacterium]|nr:hypothetical protein [Myxococcales bacterium]
MSRLSVVVSLLLAGLCGACLGEGAGASGAVMELEQDAERLTARLTALECERTPSCFAPYRAAGLIQGADLRGRECTSHTPARIEQTLIDPLARSIEAGRVVYHPEHLDACLEADEARSCQELSATPDACLMAFEGQVQVAGRCTLSYDCAGDAFCEGDQLFGDMALERCPWRCRARLSEGMPCERPIECARGLRCRDPNFDPLSGGVPNPVCLPPAAEDESCHGFHCAEGLTCAGGADGLRCRPFEAAAAEGDSCTDELHCENGLGCQSDIEPTVQPTGGVAGICQAETEGTLCSRDVACDLSQVCACDVPDCSAGPPTCQPFPAEGEPCATTLPRILACGRGLICNPSDGRCMAPRAPGEGCNDTLECGVGVCRGRCTSLGGICE